MARKTRINKEINGYTLRTAAEEFYKHNRVKGLATATQDIYKIYISTCKTRRAKGGTGIIVPGVVCVDYPRGKTVAQQLRLDQLKYINGYSRMAQEIHRYGALLILQLHHTGMSTDVLTTELALIRALHKPPLEMVVHDLSGPVLPYY